MKVPTSLALLTGVTSASSPWTRQTAEIPPWPPTANVNNNNSRQSRLVATVSRCTGGAIEEPTKANTACGGVEDLLAIGRRHILANDHALAVGIFELAVELAPRSAVAKVELGRALVRAGKAGEGFNILVGAFEIDSLCPGVKDGFREYYRAEIEASTTVTVQYYGVVCTVVLCFLRNVLILSHAFH